MKEAEVYRAALEALHDLLVVWKAWRDRPVVPNVIDVAVRLALSRAAKDCCGFSEDHGASRALKKGDVVIYQGKIGQIDAISTEAAALLNLYQNNVRVLAPLSECAIERRAGGAGAEE